MKKISVRLASLVLFFATGAIIGMESPKLIIQNEAWGFGTGGGYYDLKVSVNDSKEEIQITGGESADVGNLNGINQINIRRSGAGSSWIPSFVGISTITAEQLNTLKQEANDNIGNNLILVIGATSTGYGIYRHIWTRTAIMGETIVRIEKNNPWSLFPDAEKAKNNLNVDFFNSKEERSNLVTVAKLVLGFKTNAQPTASDIKKRYFQLAKQFHPDKTIGQADLSASVSFDSFSSEVSKILGRAYEILK